MLDGRDQDVQDGSPAVKSSKMHFVVVSDQRAVHLVVVSDHRAGDQPLIDLCIQ